GEVHDNPDHHRIQSEIIANMVKAGRRPAVVFEMIPRGMQADLDAYIAGGGDAAGLGAALKWKERGWPDWAIYQPIAEVALRAGLTLFAGDLDRDTIRAVAQGSVDALGDADRARFDLDTPLPKDTEATMLRLLSDSHCGYLPDAALAPMLAAQRARDGSLADAVAEAASKGDGAVLITGNGHVRKDWAVPAILARTHPDASVLVVSLVEAPLEDTDTGNALADFTIVTPRATVIDHCAELAKRFGKTKSEDAKPAN
ncbi:MAG: ChaN family lipoprotein, partial [Rhodobiaceae bacterium]|nr:ChaN family lipoprotein [Rhodobiaceae bacterium]